MKTLLSALALTLAAAPALAQDDDLENLDESGETRRERRTRRDGLESEVIREIERGYYLKSEVGSAFYLINYSSTLSAGTSLAFAFGSDFVDNERNSAAWEIAFSQGIHNGAPYQRQAGLPPQRLIQGDTRSFQLIANAEYSVYPSRRFGIGVRGGAGIMLTPLLMDGEAFRNDVEGGTWGVTTTVHRTPHPLVLVGPTLEYYTKLSHFSIGADVDVLYALGFDLGVDATGYLKYTF
jgi:hypothetical protein